VDIDAIHSGVCARKISDMSSLRPAKKAYMRSARISRQSCPACAPFFYDQLKAEEPTLKTAAVVFTGAHQAVTKAPALLPA
jgi:hypothetical protein